MARVVSLRDQQKQLTRQRLLESALEVFSSKGYANTTVDDLVASAGASRATFYLHFSSKLDILLKASTIATANTPDLYAALDKALADGSRAALEAAIDGIISWFEAHSGFLQAWVEAAMESPDLSRKARTLRDRFFDAMPYVRSSWPPSLEEQAKLRLYLFVQPFERFFQNHAATGEWEFPRDVLIRVLADLWSVGFFPPASSAVPARKSARRRLRGPS
ncbi:MAG TPA: TetR/AcrR family transcriptional regulator [Myxococcota bacterium]|jgi:AcrR family transcriptional regulator|nr:TetR/AcrR family transcriptional regulator [Myxococcota bacterium]